MSKNNNISNSSEDIGYSILGFAEIMKTVGLGCTAIITFVSFFAGIAGIISGIVYGTTGIFVVLFTYRLLQAAGRIVVDVGEMKNAILSLNSTPSAGTATNKIVDDELPEL